MGRIFRVTFTDAILLAAATMLAFSLRYDLQLPAAQLRDFLPYLATSVIAALIVFPALGLHRTIWRFGSMPDYIRVAIGVFFVVEIGRAHV